MGDESRGVEAIPAALTYEQMMRNVATVLMGHTEVERAYNGRGRARTYAANVDAIAETGRQLATMVLEYLDAGGLDAAHGLDGADGVQPAGVADDLPF